MPRSKVELLPIQRAAVVTILTAFNAGVDLITGPNAKRRVLDTLLNAGQSEVNLVGALQALGVDDVSELLELDALAGVDLSPPPVPLSQQEQNRAILSGRP